MSVVISLKDVVDALDMQSEDTDVYINPETGEIITITDDDRSLLEDDIDEEDLPEWQQKALPKIRADLEALEDDKLLALPDKFDIHDWGIMQDFARHQRNERAREELMAAIHGKGAFRMFRATVERFDLLDAWYKFRGEALEQIARDWLEKHKLAYK